ncbi:MAG: septum site-determining protein MinC [Wujia sp.]
MNSPVIIKGNNQGIRLIIDSEATVDEVIKELLKKLQDTKHYYKNVKPINVTFDGKALTEDETDEILETLRNIGLNTKRQNNKLHCEPDKINTIQDASIGLFHIGNIRNGQTLDATESVIILGDVEQGATVTSTGNIVVTGKLLGTAISGSTGREDTFVYSFISGGYIK